MTQAMRNVAAGCAAVALLMGAAGTANAAYLGYGNGDPGNWSFWDEQHPHKAMAQSHAHHTATHHHHAANSSKGKKHT